MTVARRLLVLLVVMGCAHYASLQEESNSDLADVLIGLGGCIKNAILDLTDSIRELNNITSSVRQELQLIRQEKELKEVETAVTSPPFPSPEPPLPAVIDPSERHPCGGTPGWRRVAYYNLSDTRYHCPPGWKLHPSPARGCGRTSHEGLTCDSAIFPVSGVPYTKICGRVLGYQFGATCAFLVSHENNSITIDQSYVTGVSITRRNPRQHIWTYAVGRYEGIQLSSVRQFCPCEQLNSVFIPPFVGACWYCESGDNSPFGNRGYNLFPDDPLWDGDGCAFRNRCCQFDGPLYFVTTLHEPVNDPIEARICNYYSSQYSNVIVSQFELYVK